MKINYGEIVTAGSEYIDAQNRFMSKYHRPGGYFITHSQPDLYDACRLVEKYETALNAVAYAFEIPASVIINAARIEKRYYERGGQFLIDLEKLLEVLA